MSLYKMLKAHLPTEKVYLSDNEFLLVNRRDYNINELSPVHATLTALGNNKVSYAYRILMGFLDSIASAREPEDFNLIVADPSLAIAAFHGWIRAGGRADRGRIYAPKGFPCLPVSAGIMADLIKEFNLASETGPAAAPSRERAEHLFTYVLGNTKSANQTAFAVMQFSKIRRGFLLLKDYARTDAFPERELMESHLMFPSVTFEGHGYILRL